MAEPDRTTTQLVELLRELQQHPYQFDFFQAVRRLECAAPHLPRIGAANSPSQEPLRFGQLPTLAFPPSTLAALEPGRDGRPPRLLVHFLGLLGANGPMPLNFTEYVRDRQRNAEDPTLARFLDVFHHRMVSLFYRAWAAAQPQVQLDRPDRDRMADYVGSFLGIGEATTQDRDTLPDWAKLYFAGHFACPTRHPSGLQRMIEELFDAPVGVQEFVARWIDVPAECRLRLGESPSTGVLGETAVVGERFWDCTQTLRIVLGPLSLSRYESLLPGRGGRRRLDDLLRNYLGEELGWEVQLVLRREEIPPCGLGRSTQLGWTSWLASDDRRRDPDDLILEPAPCVV